MKKLTFIVLALIIQYTASSQPCLPDGITFTTQEQMDDFQTNYPNCTEIEGDVTIAGYDVTNLNGLSVLTSIGGNLSVGSGQWYNQNLTSLTGLGNLNSIGGDLVFLHNNSLTSLAGFEGVISIDGDLYIGYNSALNDMTGLEGLTSIEGDIIIYKNDTLGSLSGLQNLTSIGGSLIIGGSRGPVSFEYLGNPSLLDISTLGNLTSVGNSIDIVGNFRLESLAGLENITSLNSLTIAGNDSLTDLLGIHNLATLNENLFIGYSYGYIKGNKSLISLSVLENLTSVGENLSIMGNDTLTSLSGLHNVVSIGFGLEITGNDILTSLTGLDNIDAGSISGLYIFDNPSLSTCEVLSICNFLADPSGYIYIDDNAPGCNHQEEVEEACDALTNVEMYEAENYSINPNPVKNIATFSSEEITSFEIYDLMGDLISRGKNNKVNMSNLNPGIYFVVGFDKDLHPVYKGKIIKK